MGTPIYSAVFDSPIYQYDTPIYQNDTLFLTFAHTIEIRDCFKNNNNDNVIFSQSVSLTQYVVLSVCPPACLFQLAYCLNDQAHIA